MTTLGIISRKHRQYGTETLFWFKCQCGHVSTETAARLHREHDIDDHLNAGHRQPKP